MRLLALRLETEPASIQEPLLRSIQSNTHNGIAPLSYTQQQFWLLDQAEPNSLYNVRTTFKIEGSLDVQSLRRALEVIVDRHEVLRTTVVEDREGPKQVIAQSTPIALEISDLTCFSEARQRTEIDRLLAVEAARPFDQG